MSFSREKIFFCIVIIFMVVDFTASWPIFITQHDSSRFIPSDLPGPRFSRQVVQPKWLNFGQGPVIDPTVVINQQALMEAEEIRKSIQKAVEEDTYAIQNEKQNPNIPAETLFTRPTPIEINPTHPGLGLPDWYIRMQNSWRNWTHNLLRGFRN